jgi:hypothetical protein
LTRTAFGKFAIVANSRFYEMHSTLANRFQSWQNHKHTIPVSAEMTDSELLALCTAKGTDRRSSIGSAFNRPHLMAPGPAGTWNSAAEKTFRLISVPPPTQEPGRSPPIPPFHSLKLSTIFSTELEPLRSCQERGGCSKWIFISAGGLRHEEAHHRIPKTPG